MTIATVDDLRAHYAAPRERAVKKQLAALDHHCRRFIALSPFVVIATSAARGALDASPRGGAPGFITVTDEGALLVPDAPGNNRLDSLENIVATNRVGLLFLIPGVDETLRVNGTAVLSVDPQDLERCTDARRTPTLVIRVTVEEAYLHCAKAFMRAHLWSAASLVARDALPTLGQMIQDQTGLDVASETREEMLKRYAPDL